MSDTPTANLDPTRAGQEVDDLLGRWEQQARSGDTGTIPHSKIATAFSQLSGQADPQQQQTLLTQAFAQLDPDQLSNVGTVLLQAMRDNGLTARAAGVRTTQPDKLKPADLARLTAYAQKEKPNLIQNLLNHPIIGAFLFMVLLYVLRHVFSPKPGAPAPHAPNTGSPGTTLPRRPPGSGTTARRPAQPAPTPPPAPPAQHDPGGIMGWMWNHLFGGHDPNAHSASSDTPAPSVIPHDAENDLRRN